ncbi:hypothetical protein [Mesorhizobium sp. M1396]
MDGENNDHGDYAEAKDDFCHGAIAKLLNARPLVRLSGILSIKA